MAFGMDRIPFFKASLVGKELIYVAEAVSLAKLSGDGEFTLPLVGRFNVHNALAAAAAGLAAGATLPQAKDALSRARAVRGRMERVESGQPFSVIVDYAHTPESLDKVLGLLRPLTKGRLIAVFGSAGERDHA